MWMPIVLLTVGTLTSAYAQPSTKLRNLEPAPGSGYTVLTGADGKQYYVTASNGAISVNNTPIGYIPSTSGNPSNNNEVVIDPNGDIWVIDNTGDAVKISAVITGAETNINAGTGVSITGTGTTGDPYVVTSTITQADGSETAINAGSNVTISGSGASGDPYVISSTGGSGGDGSETKINAGTNITISGTGTVGDPYVINGLAAGVVDSTRLLQDSILVYYQNNTEVGRDTLSGIGGGVTDGDKGDILISLLGTVYTIKDDVITASKIATGQVGADELSASGVSSGSYTNLNATIDLDGRITTASNGTDRNGIIDSLPNGDTQINASGNDLLIENLDSMRIEGSKLEIEAATVYKSSVGIGDDPDRSFHIKGSEEQLRLESTGLGGTDNWLEMVSNSIDPLSANIIQFYKGGTADANKFASIGIPKNSVDSTFYIGLNNDTGGDNSHGYSFSMKDTTGATFEPYANDGSLVTGTPATYPAFDSNGRIIQSSTPYGTGGGATNFTGLTDAPSTYSGEANKLVIVKDDETGLEFIDTTGLFGGSSGGSSVAELGPEYPYDTIAYSKVYDSNVDGTTNFNGGNRAYSSDSTAMMVTNGAGGAGRGAELNVFSHTANQEYTIRVDVRDPGDQGMRLYAQWSTPLTTITSPGIHYWDFTSPSGSGSFGKEIIITTNGAALDTIYINSIYVYEKNSGYNILPESDISSLVVDSINTIAPTIVRDSVPIVLDERTVLYAFNDFSENSDNTTCFGCTGTVSNGFYEATLTTSSQVVVFGASVIDSQAYYQAYFDIDIVDSSVVVRSVWSGTTGQYNTDTITQSGTYTLLMKKQFQNTTSSLDGLCFYTLNGGTVKLDKVVVNPFIADNFNEFFLDIQGITIAAGNGASATLTQSIAIGDDAKAEFDNTYGGAAGPEAVALGETSRALAWRAVALGGNAYAGSTSTTAVGAGVTVLDIHGTGLGRGAYVPDPAVVGFDVENVLGGSSTTNFYFANSWGHNFDTPVSGIGIGSVTPSSIEIKLHGQGAFDARSTPSDFNVNGGDLGLYAGPATGSGESGSINFYVADGDNGQNTKDTDVKAGEFRSEDSATTDTHFWLLDVSRGTMYKVKIGATNSGPGGSGRALYIDN